jgi:hypothetical protein
MTGTVPQPSIHLKVLIKISDPVLFCFQGFHDVFVDKSSGHNVVIVSHHLRVYSVNPITSASLFFWGS